MFKDWRIISQHYTITAIKGAYAVSASFAHIIQSSTFFVSYESE